MSRWSVGQCVFVVFDSDKRSITKTHEQIQKIGRKWGVLGSGYDTYRFDLKTGAIDGGQYISPGRVWLSEELYEEAVKAQELWDDLYRFMSCTRLVPQHLNADSLRAMAKLLKGE